MTSICQHRKTGIVSLSECEVIDDEGLYASSLITPYYFPDHRAFLAYGFPSSGLQPDAYLQSRMDTARQVSYWADTCVLSFSRCADNLVLLEEIFRP